MWWYFKVDSCVFVDMNQSVNEICSSLCRRLMILLDLVGDAEVVHQRVHVCVFCALMCKYRKQKRCAEIPSSTTLRLNSLLDIYTN